MILYLDFDGVLHHYDVYLDSKNRPVLRGIGKLFEYAELLGHTLEPHPQVEIVLSTSWVRTKGFSYSKRRLPMALQRRVIGATWHSNFGRDPDFEYWWTKCSSRYQQIAKDLIRRQPQHWLALDDDAEGWPGSSEKELVLCDPLQALGNQETLKLFALAIKQSCNAPC